MRHLLEDAPWSGRPFVYGPDDRRAIVVLACQPPAETSHFLVRDLTAAVHAQTTVRPAASTVWTVLDEAVMKPHKHRMWLHSHAPDFEAKERVITNLYRTLSWRTASC